jgi:hypothetical protein
MVVVLTNPVSESRRGQVVITKEDIARILDIVASPDRVSG